MPLNDLLVGYSDGRLSFEQAKHSITLSSKNDTPFASVVDQFVRQFIHGQDANSIHRRQPLLMVIACRFCPQNSLFNLRFQMPIKPFCGNDLTPTNIQW